MKNPVMRLLSAGAMLLVPLPFIILFECMSLPEFSLLRYLWYYAAAPVAASLGYFVFMLRNSALKPRAVFAANCAVGGAGILLSVGVIVAVALLIPVFAGNAGIFYAVIVFVPSALCWYVAGTKLTKKDFGDIFTLSWLAVYVVGTFFCYIAACVVEADCDRAGEAKEAIMTLLCVMVLLTVLLINQSNIQAQISQRKNTGLIVPKGLRGFNAALIGIVGAVFIAALMLRNVIADAILSIIRTFFKLIDLLLFNIQFEHTDPITSDDATENPLFTPEDTSLGREVLVAFLAATAVVLLVVFRKQIFAFFKKIAVGIYRRFSKTVPADINNDEYTDSYERIDIKAQKIDTLSKQDVLKAYKKEKDPTARYRLGYRLFLMWLLPRSRRLSASSTTGEQYREAAEHYYGGCDIETVTRRYDEVRYDDAAADSADSERINSLIEELY